MSDTIRDHRTNPDLTFEFDGDEYDGKSCPRCNMSFNKGPFKTLWIPPALSKKLNVIMQCQSCRMLFSLKD